MKAKSPLYIARIHALISGLLLLCAGVVAAGIILAPSEGRAQATPTCSITANGASGHLNVDSGTSATLEWTSNLSDTAGDTCTLTITPPGPPGTTKPVNGSQSSGPVTSDQTYDILCTQASTSNTCSDSVELRVLDPPIQASCSPSVPGAEIGQEVIWELDGAVSGGVGGYSYQWGGTDGLSGSGTSATITYETNGRKAGHVIITSGSQVKRFDCVPSITVGQVTEFCTSWRSPGKVFAKTDPGDPTWTDTENVKAKDGAVSTGSVFACDDSSAPWNLIERVNPPLYTWEEKTIALPSTAEGNPYLEFRFWGWAENSPWARVLFDNIIVTGVNASGVRVTLFEDDFEYVLSPVTTNKWNGTYVRDPRSYNIYEDITTEETSSLAYDGRYMVTKDNAGAVTTFIDTVGMTDIELSYARKGNSFPHNRGYIESEFRIGCNDRSDSLQLSDFGFSVPSTVTVRGVEVKTTRRGSSFDTSADSQVYLFDGEGWQLLDRSNFVGWQAATITLPTEAEGVPDLQVRFWREGGGSSRGYFDDVKVTGLNGSGARVTLFEDAFTSTKPHETPLWLYLIKPEEFRTGPFSFSDDLYTESGTWAYDGYSMVTKRNATAASRKIDTTGFTDIKLSYMRRPHSGSASNNIVVEWRSGKTGIGWFSLVGDNRALSGSWNTILKTVYYGYQTDLWGEDNTYITPDLVNSDIFGVLFVIQEVNPDTITTAKPQIDSVEMRICYGGPPKPDPLFTCNPGTITEGDPVRLRWECRDGSTTASGGNFSTGGATEGTTIVNPTEDTLYTLACEFSSAECFVKVNPADMDITASPKLIRPGQTTQISWYAENVNSCEVINTQDPTNPLADEEVPDPPGTPDRLEGSFTSPTIDSATIFKLTCDGTKTDTTTVQIIPDFDER